MQIVIDIPDRIYNILKDDKSLISNVDYLAILFKELVKKGIPLPKGHGRLVDADKLKEEIKLWDNDYTEDGYDHVIEESDIDDAPTVIEPDREVDEKGEEDNPMQSFLGYMKNLYLQNKGEVDKIAKEIELDKEE